MREPPFWYPENGGKPTAARLLSPAGYLYGLAGDLRRTLVTPIREKVPVLCIGNLTAGGAGKTPVAIAIGRWLSEQGEALHYLSRGYGGSEKGPIRVDPQWHTAGDVGDEPLMLADVAPTWVSRDRPDGARLAVQAGASMILMDDGFQNPSLAKDLSILVVDAGAGIGNGYMIPAGPLRERTASALKRAGAIVIMGSGQRADSLKSAAEKNGIPIFTGEVKADPLPELAERPYIAFSGIGRPEKFFATARRLGANLVQTISFADHHQFSEEDAAVLMDQAGYHEAGLVTTEKDFVRLRHAPEGSARAVLAEVVKIVRVKAEIDEFSRLTSLIGARIGAKRDI